MTTNITPFPLRPIARNQSIADLYRVEAALIQAGFPVEIGRGASDEGDPWVAFCHLDSGEVVAHVAVIDGEILADSPAFAGPVRTSDVDALLDKLIRRLNDAGFAQYGIRSGPYALLAALVALAALHLTDVQAEWQPLRQETLAEAADKIGIASAALIASAAIGVEQVVFSAPLDLAGLQTTNDAAHGGASSIVKMATVLDEAHPDQKITVIAEAPTAAEQTLREIVASLSGEADSGMLRFFGSDALTAVAPTDSVAALRGETPAAVAGPASVSSVATSNLVAPELPAPAQSEQEMVASILNAAIAGRAYEVDYTPTSGTVFVYVEGLSNNYQHVFSDGSSIAIVGVTGTAAIDHFGP